MATEKRVFMLAGNAVATKNRVVVCEQVVQWPLRTRVFMRTGGAVAAKIRVRHM